MKSPTAMYVAPATRFVGRERELADLEGLLADPACRLLSVIGAGGVGKTRLALEVAARRHAHSAESVAVALLQSTAGVDGVIAAIAAAVGIPLVSQASPRAQLVAALQSRQLTIVVDNLEHLLDAADVFSDLLAAAPSLKLLATSREVLNLQEEWIYRLDGLDIPADMSVAALARASAVELFVERARRVRHDFDVSADQDAVVRICRSVAGVPLALELAAAWTKTLPCGVIAREIERNSTFLETSLRNIPQRHRSMRATFDYSWQLLSEQERAVFAELSLLRGGFTREAAERIAGANIAILATLVDKSLLRVDDQGRYGIHELLRQYAEEHLLRSSQAGVAVELAHAGYFMEYLASRFDGMTGGRQVTARADIAVELDNIRVAWRHATAVVRGEQLRRAVHALRLFFLYGGPYDAGMGMLQHVEQQLRDRPTRPDAAIILADVLVGQGWLHVPAGRIAEAGALFEASEALYQSLGVPPPPGIATDPLIGRALVALYWGAYAEATQAAEHARARNEAQQHASNQAYAWLTLANVAFAQGQYGAAQAAAEHAYAAAYETQDPWLLGICWCDLGDVAYAQGRYADARRCYKASYALREGANDPQWARALLLLGRTALAEHQYAEADELYQRSLAVYRHVGDRMDSAWALAGLGRTAGARGDYATAHQRFSEAFDVLRQTAYVAGMLALLIQVAEVLFHAGPSALGVELLALVVRHPTHDRLTHTQAQALLRRYQDVLAPEVFAAAAQRGQTGTPEAVIPRALDAITQLESTAAGGHAGLEPAHHSAGAEPGFGFDVAARELVVDGERIALSHLEFEVLRYLSERVGQAVPRGDLLEDVWGYAYDGGSNVVDVVVRALRKKMGAYAAAIETVTKVGYRFRRT